MTTSTWKNQPYTNWPDRPRWVISAEHGIVDEKGRAVGGFAVVSECRRWSIARSDYEFVEGWEVRILATRNGNIYGSAFPRPSKYPTLDEAKAAAERGLAAQGRRYAKKYGKGA